MPQARVVHVHKAHPRLKINRRRLVSAVRLLDQNRANFKGGCPPGELSLAFLTDSALAKIHGDFLRDPTETDVITFEGDQSHGSAGEICVSVDTASNYARHFRQDFSRELTLYFVHGWLHLAGYDDLEPGKKRQMRTAEKRAMTLLDNASCLPIFMQD